MMTPPFLAALALALSQESAPASRPTSAPAPRLLVVEYGNGASRYHETVMKLAARRGGEWARLPDTKNPALLTGLLRERTADAVAIAIGPEELDINLHRRVLDAISKVDDDPLPDATLGYLTGDPKDVAAMLEAEARIERDGLPGSFVHGGVAVADSFLWYPGFTHTGGPDWGAAFLPTLGKNPNPRAAFSQLFEKTADAAVVSMSGNGDPMRVWLFPGERNLDPKQHWPFDPKKIVRDCADAAMPGLGAADLAGWRLGGKVLWFSTCHSGVPVHAMVAGDIVSTFGDVSRAIQFYDLKPNESFCLGLLSKGPAALVAPIGPNHGFASDVELARAIGFDLTLGETLRRNAIDVALTWREKGGIPLIQQVAGEREKMPAGVQGAIMREGTLNRILFGDPLFAPFRSIGGRKPTLRVNPNFPPGASEGTVAVEVLDPKSLESWDPYRERDKGERLVASFELPAGAKGVDSVAVDSTVPLTGFDWIVEKRRTGAPVVWFSLNAKPPGANPYAEKALWRDKATYTLRVRLAADAASARASGGGVEKR
jgi:hypothetical protein